MMLKDSREKGPSKQEGGVDDGKTVKASTSSRLWSGLKDSRIVRVSRSFGGKDRHSKVRTIRGLRDRRVRLSVPTAIQLYDLQDRLGLNQPSKVVDWLLNASQHEIDKLPPLEMPSGNFVQYPQSIAASHEGNLQASSTSSMAANVECIKDKGTGSFTLPSSKASRFKNAIEGSTHWNSDNPFRTKFKEFPREEIYERGSSISGIEQENVEVHTAMVSDPGPLPKLNHSSWSGLQNHVMPYTAYYHLEPSNVSISHLGGYYSSQPEEPYNFRPTNTPFSQSLLPGSQILLCPSGTMPSVFPSYMTASVNCDPKHIDNFQMPASASQSLLPNSLPASFHSDGTTIKLSISPKHHNSQNHHVSEC